MKFSTGLRQKMLGTASFKSLMDGGFLKIYGGAAAPGSADNALPGGATLVCTLSDDGGVGGLTWAAPTDNTITKTVAQIWRGTNAATANALWFRFVTAGDTGALSTSEERVQGVIGTAAADMLMSNTTLVNSEDFALNYFTVVFPSL